MHVCCGMRLNVLWSMLWRSPWNVPSDWSWSLHRMSILFRICCPLNLLKLESLHHQTSPKKNLFFFLQRRLYSTTHNHHSLNLCTYSVWSFWNLILFNTSHTESIGEEKIYIFFYSAALLKTRLLRLNAWSTNKFSRSFFEIYFFLYIFYYHRVLELPTEQSRGRGKKCQSVLELK